VLDAGGPAAKALTAFGLTPEIAGSRSAAESAKTQARRKPAGMRFPTRVPLRVAAGTSATGGKRGRSGREDAGEAPLDTQNQFCHGSALTLPTRPAQSRL